MFKVCNESDCGFVATNLLAYLRIRIIEILPQDARILTLKAEEKNEKVESGLVGVSFRNLNGGGCPEGRAWRGRRP
jgi:hypothetical protein